MEPQKATPNQSFHVLSKFKILLKLSALYKDRLRIRSVIIPDIILILNVLLPNMYYFICVIWLYIELEFETSLMSQSFALTVSDLQGILVYICLLLNKRLFLRAFDHLQQTVTDSKIVFRALKTRQVVSFIFLLSLFQGAVNLRRYKAIIADVKSRINN